MPLLPPGGENSSFSPFLGDDVFLTIFLGADAFGFFFLFRIQQQQVRQQQQNIGTAPKPKITIKKTIVPRRIVVDGNPNITINPARATAAKKR